MADNRRRRASNPVGLPPRFALGDTPSSLGLCHGPPWRPCLGYAESCLTFRISYSGTGLLYNRLRERSHVGFARTFVRARLG